MIFLPATPKRAEKAEGQITVYYMQTARFHMRIWHWLLLALAAGGIAFTIAWFCSLRLEEALKNQLLIRLNRNPHRIYDFKIGQLQAGLNGGSFLLTDISATPLPRYTDSLRNGPLKTIVSFKAKALLIKGTAISKLLSGKKLSIRELELKEPEFSVGIFSQSLQPPIHWVFRHAWKDIFPQADIRLVTILHPRLFLYKMGNDSIPLMVADGAHFVCRDLHYDPNTADYNRLPFSLQDLVIQDLRVQLKQCNNYTFQTKQVSFHTHNKVLQIMAPALLPPLEAAAYARQYPDANEWMKIEAKQCNIYGLNLNYFAPNSPLHIRYFEALGSVADYYRLPAKTPIHRAHTARQLFGIDVRIDTFDASGMQFHCAIPAEKGRGPANLRINKIALRLTQLSYQITRNNTALLQFDALNLNTGSFNLPIGKNNVFAAKGLRYDGKKQFLLMEAPALISRLSPQQCASSLPEATDWISAKAKAISCKGLDLMHWIKHHRLEASTLKIEQADLRIYRDKTKPVPHHYKPLPAYQIRHIALPFRIGTIHVQNSRIIYTEKDPLTLHPAVLVFSHLNLSASQVSNLPAVLKKSPELVINASARFMDDGLINTTIRLQARQPGDAFSAKGSLGPMPATLLSPVMENLQLIKIPSGYIKGIQFQFWGNEERATGKLAFEYRDLRFDILQQKGLHNSNRLLNALGGLLIKKENMKTNPDFRLGTIDFERYKNRSVFNYWWNSIKTGLISTLMPFASHSNKKKEDSSFQPKKDDSNGGRKRG